MRKKVLVTTLALLACWAIFTTQASSMKVTDNDEPTLEVQDHTIISLVGGTHAGKMTIKKLLENPKVTLSNAPEGSKIASFELSYETDKGKIKTLKAKSELFTKKMIEAINGIKPPAEIYFENIKVETKNGSMRECKGTSIELAKEPRKKRGRRK